MKNIKITVIIIGLIVVFGVVALILLKKSPVVNQSPNISKEVISSPSTQITTPAIFTYTHPEFGFSFKYSSNLSIGREQESDTSEILLIQSKEKGAIGQIYISSFPESAVLSAELLQKEFPGKKFLNGKKVLIGDMEAFSFESEADGTGKTWEVVYANNGYIYQAMSTINNRNEFESILTTWEF